MCLCVSVSPGVPGIALKFESAHNSKMHVMDLGASRSPQPCCGQILLAYSWNRHQALFCTAVSAQQSCFGAARASTSRCCTERAWTFPGCMRWWMVIPDGDSDYPGSFLPNCCGHPVVCVVSACVCSFTFCAKSAFRNCLFCH